MSYLWTFTPFGDKRKKKKEDKKHEKGRDQMYAYLFVSVEQTFFILKGLRI